jgi:hypothetical protein
MSDEMNTKVQNAATFMAMAKTSLSIKLAMHYVGFSVKEIENRSVQQNVRRAANKMQMKAPPTVAPSTAKPSVLSAISRSRSRSSLRSTHVCQGEKLIPSSSILESSILPSSPTFGRRQSRSRTRSDKEELRLSSKHLQATILEGEDCNPSAKKNSRMSSVQRQKTHAEACLKNKNADEAFKLATSRYALSLTLEVGDPEKKSSRIICEEVNALKDSSVTISTVCRYVRKDLINISPIKRGKVPLIPKSEWTSLRDAYSTFIMLEQANKRDECTTKKLVSLVGKCLRVGGFSMNMDKVTNRLKVQTADLISAGKGNPQELRRLVWTTFQNLNTWFDTFHEIVVRLGFARKRTDDDPEDSPEVIFFPGQEERIINFDESPVAIDNTSGEKGGRPPTTFSSTSLPAAATPANKAGYACTFIGGSTAAGTPVPPHFQLKTAAKSVDREQIKTVILQHVKRVRGKFGNPKEKLHGVTFGMNEKGGMDSTELAKYLESAILPLYPDLEDKPGKRVLIKVDSGPGRTNTEMLAKFRLRGVYFVPGVPNTTHVTQETDQNYGPFKTVYFHNLEILVKSRYARGMTLSVADIPLLVFGGIDGEVELEDAFAKAFSVERNLAVWKKVGTVPLTRACLLDAKVAHQVVTDANGVVDVDADPMTSLLLTLEHANHLACDHLCAQGCDGDQLRSSAPRVLAKAAVTEHYSRERQDALMAANTAGKHYHATGGYHLNSDDYFIAQERMDQKRQAGILEKEKKARLAAKQRQEDASALLADLGRRSVDVYDSRTSLVTLKSSELRTLVAWKLGGEKVPTTKSLLIGSWMKNKNFDRHLSFEEWTQDDEARLAGLIDEDIKLGETELGRQQDVVVQSVKSTVGSLSASRRAEIMAIITQEEARTEAPSTVVEAAEAGAIAPTAAAEAVDLNL